MQQLKVGMQIVHESYGHLLWVLEIYCIEYNTITLLCFNPSEQADHTYTVLNKFDLDNFQSKLDKGVWRIVDNKVDFDIIRLLYG